jgi:hypothetical protein
MTTGTLYLYYFFNKNNLRMCKSSISFVYGLFLHGKTLCVPMGFISI